MSDPIPSNSITAFKQSSAPVGWTKLTTLDDHAIRINSSGAGSAVSNRTPFSTIFSNREIVGTYNSTGTINPATISGVAPHTHPYRYGAAYTAGSSSLTPSTPTRLSLTRAATSVGSAGSNSPHTHTVSPSSSGTSPWTGVVGENSIDFAINYIDVIIAQRN